MAKVIYINENDVSVLSKSLDEMTYFKFYTEVKKFIKELFSNPLGADISDYLKGRGLNKDKLLDKMLDWGIIVKKEGFDERYDSKSNKKKSIHHLQYSIPKKNLTNNILEDKMHRLYDFFK